MEKLFSYGTLRYEKVQLSTFGRKLEGTPDTLNGYRLSSLQIKDPKVLSISGEAIHPVIIYTGKMEDEVSGIVFNVSLEELQLSDHYEVKDYKRINVRFRSGLYAWAYVSVYS